VHEGHLLAGLKNGLVQNDLKGRRVEPDSAEETRLERGLEYIRKERRRVNLPHRTSRRRASSLAAAA